MSENRYRLVKSPFLWTIAITHQLGALYRLLSGLSKIFALAFSAYEALMHSFPTQERGICTVYLEKALIGIIFDKYNFIHSTYLTNILSIKNMN